MSLNNNEYDNDAVLLYKAMEGWGCNKDPIIEITARRSNKDRQKIIKSYERLYKRDLLQDLTSEIGGDMGKLVQALYKSPIDYDCQELYLAMKGIGTNEDTLIEIIGTRQSSELRMIKERYKEIYKKDLIDEVKSETSGELRALLTSLLQCQRSETKEIDENSLNKIVIDLYNAGEGKSGTDDSVFNRIFSKSSHVELRYINKKYHEETGRNLLDVLDNEYSGDLLKLYRTIIICIINPIAYYSRRINEACKGLGTNDSLLIRILVSREEKDLKEIDRYYKEKYSMNLKEQVEDECSGPYLKLLLGVIKSRLGY